MKKIIQPVSIFLLSAAVFLPINANADIWSTFDSSSEDWTSVEYTNEGVFVKVLDNDPFSDVFGMPPGSVLAKDPTGDTASRFNAPVAFLGDKSDYFNGMLTFNLAVVVEPGGSAVPHVPSIVEIIGGDFDPGAGVLPLAIGYTDVLPGTAPAPDNLGPTYNVPLSDQGVTAPLGEFPPLGSWILYDPADGPTLGFVYASNEDIQNVLANILFLTLNGEITDHTDDQLALDNFHMHLVPLPAALPLFVSALFGLGFASRRNRRC